MSATIDSGVIRDRIEQVKEKIFLAAQRVARDPSIIKLLVVSKTKPVSVIEMAVEAGVCDFGENYVEETVEKMAHFPPDQLKWHMIGHIQSRKAKLVSTYFDYVHSLDRLKLAQRLDRFAAESGRVLPVLLECNSSGETSKFGWSVYQEYQWPELAIQFEEILNLQHLKVKGLMTMPPFADDPELARPFFYRLRKFQDYLRKKFPQTTWNEMSMGMSGDYEVAVEEGATWIRIGQKILGPRV